MLLKTNDVEMFAPRLKDLVSDFCTCELLAAYFTSFLADLLCNLRRARLPNKKIHELRLFYSNNRLHSRLTLVSWNMYKIFVTGFGYISG